MKKLVILIFVLLTIIPIIFINKIIFARTCFSWHCDNLPNARCWDIPSSIVCHAFTVTCFQQKPFYSCHLFKLDSLMIQPTGINNGAFVFWPDFVWYALVLLLFSASATTDTRSTLFDCALVLTVETYNNPEHGYYLYYSYFINYVDYCYYCICCSIVSVVAITPTMCVLHDGRNQLLALAASQIVYKLDTNMKPVLYVIPIVSLEKFLLSLSAI